MIQHRCLRADNLPKFNVSFAIYGFEENGYVLYVEIKQLFKMGIRKYCGLPDKNNLL